MSSFRYRAFLSYSHADEKWARWLHRALETYRLPRNVPGAEDLPRRIAPVFRDRDELVASQSVSNPLTEALAESENLLVICSPSAAGSQWVNEEVRKFRELGRGDHIFCLIVEGSVGDPSSKAQVFPPALFEGVQDNEKEPLAADPRSWADGKQLALQKLVAAMLGLRLDDLRQREHQRRRMRIGGLSVAASALMALVIFTAFTWLSEKKQRARTEELAGFMVDLGDRVRTNVDLDTLLLITSQANKVYEDMDWKSLPPELGTRVAVAVRQLAVVNQDQGRKTEALEGLQRSQEQLEYLSTRYPDVEVVHFELSQSQFYLGNYFFFQNEYETALDWMEDYQSTLDKLVGENPQNAEYQLERSYALTNQAAVRFNGRIGRYDDALELVEESNRTFEVAMRLMPENVDLIGDHANMMAWAADAYDVDCRLEDAVRLRKEGLVLAQRATSEEPGNNKFQAMEAYAHAGLAELNYQRGMLESGLSHIQLSSEKLKVLLAGDPTNSRVRRASILTNLAQAKVLSGLGRYKEAQVVLNDLAPTFVEAEIPDEDRVQLSLEYTASFHLTMAQVYAAQGDTNALVDALRQAHTILQDVSPAEGASTERMRIQLRYLADTLLADSIFSESDRFGLQSFESDGGVYSCPDLEQLAKLDVMSGDLASASERIAQLEQAGYRAPSFLAFCDRSSLCAGISGPTE